MAAKKFTDEQFIEDRLAGLKLREIAEKYGVAKRNVEARSAKLAKSGFGHGGKSAAGGGDLTPYIPEGYKIRGISALVNRDGVATNTWIKSEADKDRQYAMMREAVAALCEEIPPVKPQKISKAQSAALSDNLLNLYTLSDFHLGMLAWGEESGDDWDMKIAQDLFIRWFGEAFAEAPAAKTAVINLQGDFAHFDSLDAVTPASGNVLDADTRYQKLVRYMIRMVRMAIEMALAKHEKVVLMIVQGNHDETGMIWLAETFNVLFEQEPRVFVDTDPDVYKMVEHGKTTLFFHHGHKARFDAIEAVMISKFRKAFGASEFSYAHVGHLHHQKIVESRNMIVEQHRTLAAKDAYASRGGWMSGRSANVITYHKDYGEVARLTISPEMLK